MLDLQGVRKNGLISESIAHIEGINIVKYQIERGISHNLKFGMSKLCSFIHGDYMNIPVSDNEYDSAYSIEATCHAPCKLSLFKEIYRVLKPGGIISINVLIVS